MTKIILISEQFTSPIFYRRWQVFAQLHPDTDVTLLAPNVKKFNQKKTFTMSKTDVVYGKELEEGNFHIKLITRKDHGVGWTSPEFKDYFTSIKPDVIYVGGHFGLHLIQVLRLRKKHFPNTKVISFSMRGPAYNLENWKMRVTPFSRYLKRRFIQYYYAKAILNYCNNNVDAIMCHYPRAVECFKKEGYTGPIYMQTQVGVNPELFHENPEWRKEIRDKYSLGDSFVFASATRFVLDKGVDDIIEALPREGNWKYLIMGGGKPDEVARIEAAIKKKNLPDKIIMAGFIDLPDMKKYYNAIDCLIHVTHTTETWEETFSIALAQCMITKKPIIGSDSGSVPYQLGPDAMFIHEKDINALTEKIKWVLDNQDKAKEIGLKMYERAFNAFNIFRLGELFYRTVKEDIIPGKYDLEKSDMVGYWQHRNETGYTGL